MVNYTGSLLWSNFNPYLSKQLFLKDSTYLDHYYVKVSTDGGTTWTVVWDASTLTGDAWNYYDYPYSIDLSAFRR